MLRTTAGIEYFRLEEELLSGRSLETLDEAAEDALLDAMDGPWWRMTDDERAEADQRPVAGNDRAGAGLGLDREHPESPGWPREAMAS